MKYSYSGEELRKSESAPAAPGPAMAREAAMPSEPADAKRKRYMIYAAIAVAVLAAAWYLVTEFCWYSTDVNIVIGPPLVYFAKDGAKTEVSVQSAIDYLTPSKAEINQLYNYVIESPFVRNNPAYYKRVAPLPVYYFETNDVVNAGATRRAVQKDGKQELVYATEIYGGAARYARLVALAAVLQDSGKQDALKEFVRQMPRQLCWRCSEKDALKLIEQGGLVPVLADATKRQRAVSYSSGTIVSVIAHEMGHHALGHMTGFYEKQNLEIARNQEREADSFASSVISSSPFGEYVFAGTLFWHYAVAMQADGDSDLKDSHPLSKERFENFVRANAEKAAAMGIVIK